MTPAKRLAADKAAECEEANKSADMFCEQAIRELGRCARLEAEIERLRELLKPFAAAADKADAKIEEARQLRMGELTGEASTGLGIKFKHLWAARAALFDTFDTLK